MLVGNIVNYFLISIIAIKLEVAEAVIHYRNTVGDIDLHPYRNGVRRVNPNNPEKIRILREFELENTPSRRGVERLTNGNSTLRTCKKPNLFEDGNDGPWDDIPNHFDARETWTMCPSLWEIREQGSCSSWAVVMASVLTDRYCIAASKQEITQFRFSDQDILTCASAEADWESDNTVEGCLGANVEKVIEYLQTNGSVSGGAYGTHLGCRPSEHAPCDHIAPAGQFSCSSQAPSSEDKYAKCRRVCNSLYSVPYEKDKIQVESSCIVEKRSMKSIQWEIMQNGPVFAVMRLYDSLYRHNPKTEELYINESERPPTGNNHAVKIIGWGVTETNPSKDYWIVANSWNYYWGKNGFFNVYRGEGPGSTVKGADIMGQVYSVIPRLPPNP